MWAGCWLAVPWSLGAVVYVRTASAARARRDLVARTALEERVRVSREAASTAALQDLRGVLHLDQPSEPGAVSGIGDLVSLIERARAAGLPRTDAVAASS